MRAMTWATNRAEASAAGTEGEPPALFTSVSSRPKRPTAWPHQPRRPDRRRGRRLRRRWLCVLWCTGRASAEGWVPTHRRPPRPPPPRNPSAMPRPTPSGSTGDHDHLPGAIDPLGHLHPPGTGRTWPTTSAPGWGRRRCPAGALDLLPKPGTRLAPGVGASGGRPSGGLRGCDENDRRVSRVTGLVGVPARAGRDPGGRRWWRSSPPTPWPPSRAAS